jgi:protein-histidine N-methyltransferase
MAEANPFAVEADSADALLAGLENGDLSSGVYEGGFKTWECALDLASLLLGPMSRLPLDPHVGQDWEIIELGAGSAIPSLAILGDFLRQRATGGNSHGRGNLRFTLCDYNVDVLRLATAPNVFLNYFFAVGNASSSSSSSSPRKAGEDEGDIDLEEIGAEALVADTVKGLLAHNVTINFISGAWGSDFVDIVTSHPDSSSATSSTPPSGPSNLLILASETIYSPASIRNFSRTIIALLRTHQQRHHTTNTGTGTAKAWVAAKKVYFGVGGGVDEFTRELELLGGRSIIIFETKDTGVGRVVLEVTVGE